MSCALAALHILYLELKFFFNFSTYEARSLLTIRCLQNENKNVLNRTFLEFLN